MDIFVLADVAIIFLNLKPIGRIILFVALIVALIPSTEVEYEFKISSQTENRLSQSLPPRFLV
jgi:hypothetical protein